MKLRRLRIDRLPGIDTPFELAALGAGFQVVHGPNGIGKSSVCRAVTALLWEDLGPDRRVQVSGEFDLDGERWWAERDGANVRWQRNGSDTPPPDLPASHLHRCFFLGLRDLIEPAAKGTPDVAAEIRRQMSGGFDLARVISDRFEPLTKQLMNRRRREYDEAVKAVKTAEREQKDLQRRADRLDEIAERLGRAEHDESRLNHVDRAIELAKRRNVLEAAEGEISALPKSLAKITGSEVERVETHAGELETLRGSRAALERELEDAERKREESGLSAPIDPTQLKTWRAWAGELQRLELERRNAEKEQSKSTARLHAATVAVGGGDAGEVELDLEGHARVFDFLRAAQDVGLKTEAIEARLRLLAKLEFSEDDRRLLEQSNDAAAALRAWLRAPGPESSRQGSRSIGIWLAVAVLLAILGAGLAYAIHPGLALLAGAGGGIFLALLIMRLGQPKSTERQNARTTFANSGADEPEAWEPKSVADCLRELELRIADLMAAQIRARYRDGERLELQNSLEGLQDDRAQSESERREWRDRLKLDGLKPDAELVDLARALDQLRQARAEERAAAAGADEIGARADELLGKLAEVLTAHGEASPGDAAAAAAGIEQLVQRDAQFTTARSEEQQIKSDMARDGKDIAEHEQSIQRIYASAEIEPGDLHGLRSLVGRRQDFEDLRTKSTSLQSKNDLDSDALEKADEAALAQADEAALERTRERLSKSAATISELRDEIADINAEVKSAQSGHKITDLIEARDAALAELRAHVDQAIFKSAGRVLVGEVAREHEEKRLPRVLARARELFATFTHHGYEIEVDSDKETARLTARDLRTGEGLGLEELSDGTRVQLLLAARIAYAEEAERGALLPLFLDEALDQSDPARYRAMVRSLGRAAADAGRQIFYFTSDPADIERIQAALAEEQCPEARPIDLARIRGVAEGVRGPDQLHVPEQATIPAPEGRSAEEYGAAIGATPLDPQRGADDQHLFHLLWDDLALLHGLLGDGIQWVGKWLGISAGSLADKWRARSEIAVELDPRAELLEGFCGLWNQGRGRPVDRDALAESGALSDHYLEAVLAIAAENRGDATRLIATLQPKNKARPKGLRANSVDALEQFLQERGYLDDRPVLDEEELHAKALAAPAAAGLPDGCADQCIRRWWVLSERASRSA